LAPKYSNNDVIGAPIGELRLGLV